MPRTKRKRAEVIPTTRRRRSSLDPPANKRNDAEIEKADEKKEKDEEVKDAATNNITKPQQEPGDVKVSPDGTSAAAATASRSTSTAAAPPLNDEAGNDHAAGIVEKATQGAAPSNNSKKQSTRSSSNNVAESETPAAAAAAAAPSTTDTEEAATERIASIQELLEHRKTLLKRVRQGRTVAQRRINAIVSKDPNKKTQTDVEEIAAFRAMTKTVNSLARKQAKTVDDGGGGERRSSVSLRRGSSVGKRMNAAISSLAPGGGTAAAAAAAAAVLEGANKQQRQHPQTAQKGLPPSVASTLAAASAVGGGSSGAATKAPKVPRPGSATGRGGGGGQRKVQAGGSGRPAATAASVLRQQASNATAAVGGGLTLSGIPGRRPVQKQPSVAPKGVVCPETMALRERRDQIRRRLALMIQERQRRAEALKSSSSSLPIDTRRNSLASVSSAATQQQHLKSPSNMSAAQQQRLRSAPISPTRQQREQRRRVSRPLWMGPAPSPQLPSRRKTHWDTLLEEMKWTATDFMEERKWKQSTARMVGTLVTKQTCLETEKMDEDKSSVAPIKDLEKGDDDMDVDDGRMTKSQTIENEEPATFCIKVSPEDEDSARAMAKTLSRMVSELVRSNTLNGVFSHAPNAEHSMPKAPPEQETTTSLPTSDEAAPVDALTGRVSDSPGVTNQDVTSAEALTGDSANHSGDVPSHEKSVAKVELMEKASKHIDMMLDSVRNKPADLNGSKRAQALPKTHGLNLSDSEKCAVDTIEDLWNRVHAGAVLTGSVASGKTIASCSLLWRKRSSGPQLLICSPSSMIRWMHELGRFPDFSIKTFSWVDNDGSSYSAEEFKGREVVVCQYSQLSKVSEKALTKFCSIVIDCRFPVGFDGSRSPTVAELDNATTEASKSNNFAPVELTCSSWWTRIASAVSHREADRLIIDNPCVNDSLQFLRGLSKRPFLDVLALRTALLFGTTPFLASEYSISKSVLAWARRNVKSSPGPGSRFERVKELIDSIAKPFFCSIETSEKLEDEELFTKGSVSWEVRRCQMTPSQRSAYDRACSEVRSSVSRSLEVTHSTENESFGAAILRLRRHCTHSDIGAALRNSSSQSPVCISSKIYHSHESKLKQSFNPSQPNIELARRLLSGSSKLQELLSVLLLDCGVDLVADDLSTLLLSDGGTPQRPGGGKRGARKMKKAVILAALPEIQLIVSLLLNSIGVKHEIFLRPSSFNAERVPLDSEIAALAWTHCQLMLSKFNSQESPWKTDVKILISSPLSIAGDHGGLGVEGADFIISLDEDWSGRGELLMRSLVLRSNRYRKYSLEGSCRLIRLVAKDSCEETFLTPSPNMEHQNYATLSADDRRWPLPVNEFGLFVPRPLDAKLTAAHKHEGSWRLRPSSEESFLFPGCNLFQHRGQDLDKILRGTKSLPRSFFSSSSDILRFFPLTEGEDARATERMVLRQLLKDEELASSLSYWKLLLRRSADFLVPIVPPSPPEFPNEFLDRPDLRVAPMKLYLENVSENAALKEFGSEGASDSKIAPAVNLSVDPELLSNDEVMRDPEEVASSILFYKSASIENQPPEISMTKTSDFLSAKRANFYSSSFGFSMDSAGQNDGNQGSEALVYFPPLFPRMQECAALAKSDVESLWTRSAQSNLPEAGIEIGLKRTAELSVESSPDSKRPRVEEGSQSASLAEPEVSQSDTRSQQRVITEDEASHSDAASVLMDLYDDYGLAGMGAVPLPRDSALTAAKSINGPYSLTGSASVAQNDWIASTPLCDVEEIQAASLPDSSAADKGSMILFVSKKRPRGYSGLPSTSSLAFPHLGLSTGISFPAGAGALSGITHFSDGTGRKGKKASAFDRLPTIETGQAAQSQIQKKDLYRHRLLAILRQSSMGTTMFESPSFRVASVRVRSRVGDRLVRHSWTSATAYDAGPGLPLLVSKQPAASTPGYRGMFDVDPNLWTSIVKRLKNKNSATGGESMELAMAQRSALRRSLIAPCRVDFGPFQCGFLSTTSGTTIAAPPRSRAGVSLPMGVKIVYSSKDQPPLHWTEDEDSHLQGAAVQFGMNWILAARVLSGFQDIMLCSQTESHRFKEQRAARTCRDRWQTIARKNPSLIVKVRQSEQFTFRVDQIPEGGDHGRRVATQNLLEKPENKTPVEFLLPSSSIVNSSQDDAKEQDSAIALVPAEDANNEGNKREESPRPQSRRSFSVFRSAKARKQEVSISIPGVPIGSPPSMVPCHPSHDEAVKTSVSASWSGGRTDMWPLQLLDVVEKQRAAVAAADAAVEQAAKAVAPTSSAPGRQTSSSSRHHHNTVSASSNRGGRGITGGLSQHRTSTSSAGQRAPGVSNAAFAPAALNNSALVHVSKPPASRNTPVNSAATAAAKQSFAPPVASTSSKAPAATTTVAPTAQPPRTNPDDRGRSGQPAPKST